MARKVTLAKRCGNPNCTDPRCDFVIVEKRESIWKQIKKVSILSVFPGIVKWGVMFFLLYHIPRLINFFIVLGG